MEEIAEQYSSALNESTAWQCGLGFGFRFIQANHIYGYATVGWIVILFTSISNCRRRGLVSA
jgi:hypothetical protein